MLRSTNAARPPPGLSPAMRAPSGPGSEDASNMSPATKEIW
jgi:hypothetical protein